MTKIEVLNPGLYNALVKRFGSVRVSNQGQRMVERMLPNPYKTKEYTSKVVYAGEHYRVCCPYCGDSRFRLYINYRWNSKDKADGPIKYRYMAHCHNEGCDMAFLDEELKRYVHDIPVIKRSVSDEFNGKKQFEQVSLPGSCVKLSDLPAGHRALEYVKGRNFDPAELEEKWGVCYCLDANHDEEGLIPGTRIYASLVKDRLVVPIRWEGKLVGWQARSLEDGVRIKYYTMPGLQKQQMLFNGDKARTFDFGVIVEGVFDAFRVGDRAVALLGKSVSYTQLQLIYSYWTKGGCCLMLDSDALDDMDKTSSMFNSSAFKYGFFSVPPPDGFDPGSMTHQDIWSLISKYGRNRGIPLASCR